jgi:eukaryotic translation initiation factor 2C
MGGINTKLQTSGPSARTTDFSTIPTLIMGADVAHAAPDSVAPSIAAVVASNDLTATGYCTETRVQISREEIIVDLEGAYRRMWLSGADNLPEMTLILMKKFYKNSNKKPARIIFYRDGVSEGQFAEVSVREILAVKRACAKIDASYKPPITYVCARG